MGTSGALSSEERGRGSVTMTEDPEFSRMGL